ncbi:hypothetical protein [Algoriphagus sp.]|jgi:hypothetical protein|uniref:hypothetical protein n=1 Tax=Algoriphagus sp. TaxID=1872435 RepID=UPI00271AC425|nr:hypothetical protein [Algoriphagus sp.]MDO8968531.1 hypothetical protein [Algoriphagus sp.]MDP3200692.1 hypothetical protein [Algoriphagus sp.]
MILLKVILASLLLIGVTKTKKEYSKEYDLINYLACETNEYALVDERFLSWEDSGFNSYSDLPTKNKNSVGGLGNFDLDSLLDEKDRRRIEHKLKSSSSLTINIDYLTCKDKLNKTKGFVPKKTIYSYSYPILLKGTNQELYGIILEQETFEINNELKIKVFLKRSDSWELVYESLIAFS